MKMKPEEITAIIKQQIQDYDVDLNVDDVGTVLDVGDGIAHIYGLERAMAGELLELPHGVYGLVLNLELDNVGAVLLGDDFLIKEGDEVEVKFMGYDDRKKMRLSRKVLLPKPPKPEKKEDKLAGEPVDIMVNGKYLAKGEVVVIDENFGVRITEIVSPLERAARLQ